MTPTIVLGTTTAHTGDSVSISGAGFSAGRAVTISVDGTTVATTSSDTSGTFSTTFAVRESSFGSHAVTASDATFNASANLFVQQTMSVSPASGAAGSRVTVRGFGFNSNQAITITYSGASVATSPASVVTSNVGSFTATFEVPSGYGRSVPITVSDGTNSGTATFSLVAGLRLSTSSGNVGSQVTVNGSGFSGDTSVSITFNSANINQTRADAAGNFSFTFEIPANIGGAHTITASDGTYTASAAFSVTSSIRLSPNSGKAGTKITVRGSGFGTNETGITLTYDSKPVVPDISADSRGSWSATFTVPMSASGFHTVDASGPTTTASAVSDMTFTIGTAISVNPAIGNVGGAVTVAGSGFALNSRLRLSYDDQEVPIEQRGTTDNSGSFSVSITIPKSKHGTHTIKILDEQGNESQVDFAVENTPPEVPRPLSPVDGARVGIVGKARPVFRWSGVKDPSGVTFTLQVDTAPDFSQPVLEKTDITGSQYNVTILDALPLGEYYWRIKAVDGASNESAWSPPQLLKSGLMALGVLIALIVGIILAVGGFIYLLVALRRRKKPQAIAFPGVEMPEVVPGQWRLLEEPQEASTPRALPWRLALPQPAKGAKVMPVEDQARLKVIIDFAQSLPLVGPGYDTKWLVDLVETGMGVEVSARVQEQLLKGEFQLHYEPAWIRHPTYQDLVSLLEGQPLLQDLNSFVDAVNHCAAEAVQLLGQIYRDARGEISSGFLEKGGWTFISGVYSDALSWFLGKSLRDPSERDYSLKPRSVPGQDKETLWLFGDDSTNFAGPLIGAVDEPEALRLRALHLRLRRTYRNNDGAKQLIGTMSQIEVQRDRLVNVLRQFGPPL